MSQSTPLKRRIAPSVPLTLTLTDDNGAEFAREFRLSFDFNAAALVEDKTGLNLLTAEVWVKLTSSNLSILFYASLLAHHPEYGKVGDEGCTHATDTGLEIVRSYMDVGNTDQIHEAVWNAYFLSLPKEKRDALERAKREVMEAMEAKLSGIERVVPQKVAAAEPPPATSSPDGSSSGQLPATTSG